MSLLFFSTAKTGNQSSQMLWKMSSMQIMARPLVNTSGFVCTVDFESPSMYL